MAAINFPDSPSNGDTHVVDGVTYTYNSAETKWKTTINSNAFLPLSGGTVSGNIVMGGEIQHDGDTDTKIHFDTDIIKLDTAGSERFRVGSAGQLGIGGATYGTSGQVLTSQGSGSAPQWADAGGGYTWTSAVTMSGNNLVDILGIPDGTTQIFVSIENCSWVTAQNNAMQFNVGQTNIDFGNNYTWAVSYSGTGVSQQTSPTSYYRCMAAVYSSGSNMGTGYIIITKTASSSWVLSSTISEQQNGNTSIIGGGRYFGGDEINRVRFTCPAGNYDSGRIRVGYA